MTSAMMWYSWSGAMRPGSRAVPRTVGDDSRRAECSGMGRNDSRVTAVPAHAAKSAVSPSAAKDLVVSGRRFMSRKQQFGRAVSSHSLVTCVTLESPLPLVVHGGDEPRTCAGVEHEGHIPRLQAARRIRRL